MLRNTWNTSLLKWQKPNKVIKVARRWDGLSSEICQNPLLVSSFEMPLSHSAGLMSCPLWAGGTLPEVHSCCGASEPCKCKSYHSLFGTTTIPAHHLVGWSTFKLTLRDFIMFCFSPSTCWWSGSGTWQLNCVDYLWNSNIVNFSSMLFWAHLNIVFLKLHQTCRGLLSYFFLSSWVGFIE